MTEVTSVLLATLPPLPGMCIVQVGDCRLPDGMHDPPECPLPHCLPSYIPAYQASHLEFCVGKKSLQAQTSAATVMTLGDLAAQLTFGVADLPSTAEILGPQTCP